MEKIDCQLTTNFYKEWNRMCDSFGSCEECILPQEGFEFCDYSCGKLETNNIEKVIGIIQKWSDEHLIKTRLDDLLEKYPNFNLDDKGRPVFVPRVFGYCDGCESCRMRHSGKCWEEPFEKGCTGRNLDG